LGITEDYDELLCDTRRQIKKTTLQFEKVQELKDFIFREPDKLGEKQKDLLNKLGEKQKDLLNKLGEKQKDLLNKLGEKHMNLVKKHERLLKINGELQDLPLLEQLENAGYLQNLDSPEASLRSKERFAIWFTSTQRWTDIENKFNEPKNHSSYDDILAYKSGFYNEKFQKMVQSCEDLHNQIRQG